MDSSWEGLAFGEDSEAIGKSGDVVLWGNIHSLNWLLGLKEC
jgi:hypothetical protein